MAMNPAQRKSLRARIFARDDNKCVYCGSPKRLTLDHDWPISRGGTNSGSNVVTACYACNHNKRDMSGAEFRRWLVQHPKFLQQRGIEIGHAKAEGGSDA